MRSVIVWTSGWGDATVRRSPVSMRIEIETRWKCVPLEAARTVKRLHSSSLSEILDFGEALAFAATVKFGQLFRLYICVTAMLFMWISSRVGVGIDLLLLTGPYTAELDTRVPCSPLQFPRRPQRSGGHHIAAVPPRELAHFAANLRRKTDAPVYGSQPHNVVLARSLARSSAERSSVSNRCGATSPSQRVGWKGNVERISSRTKARYTSWLASHRAAATMSLSELRMQKQHETRDEP